MGLASLALNTNIFCDLPHSILLLSVLSELEFLGLALIEKYIRLGLKDASWPTHSRGNTAIKS
jgi:hypothetical protein